MTLLINGAMRKGWAALEMIKVVQEYLVCNKRGVFQLHKLRDDARNLRF